jgi:hypothetical protein
MAAVNLADNNDNGGCIDSCAYGVCGGPLGRESVGVGE